MIKKKTFLDSPEWKSIVDNIKGIQMSDGTINTLMDFERVLDNADIYAFKNWGMGELVDGPKLNRYTVEATFMWPQHLMPDPRAGMRLIETGCSVKFKKTTIKSPVEIKNPDDFKPGTHYPKLIDRGVWLAHITIPRELMDDIKQGSVEIAGQNIDMEDLDDAYEKDYDKIEKDDDDQDQQPDAGLGADGDMGAMGGAPAAPMGGM